MSTIGVVILEQQTLYRPTLFGPIGLIISLIVFLYAISLWMDVMEPGAGIASIICFTCFILFLVLTFTDTHKTLLNKPDKIRYTIEITDDNAWKELGPNYDVIEKVYNDKEIYIIEGDYVE